MGVALACYFHHFGQSWPLGAHATERVLEDLLGARLAQGFALKIEVLIQGRDTGVANEPMSLAVAAAARASVSGSDQR